MYKLTKNIKNTSTILILIGIVSLGIGFYQSLSVVSDDEIKSTVKDIAKELDLEYFESNQKDLDWESELKKDNLILNEDDQIIDRPLNFGTLIESMAMHDFELKKEEAYTELIHKVEEKLHCHIDPHHVHSVEDVIYAAKHYFHAKHQRPWSSLLISTLFFLMVSVAATLWWALQYVAQAGWSALLLRIPMAISSFIPYGAFIMLFIIITGGLHWHHTYHWMAEGIMDPANHHYDEIIANKSAYLNIPFFILRSIIYIAGWMGFAYLLKRYSVSQDRDGNGMKWYNKSYKIAVIFVLFLGVTSSTAAWDWTMSIDTHWFSTLFGWYSLASFFITACAFIAGITIYLMYNGYFKELNNSHMHDFGRYMLAFSIFWTYLWFAQYMLIWYANIPEEVTYFQERYEYFYPLIIITLLINFVSPFLLLMNRSAKRSKGKLLFVAGLIIIGHFLDVFLMITPGTMHDHWHLGYVEIGTFLGFLGFFIWVVFRNLSKYQLIQKNHPMIGESEHHEIHIH